MKWRPGADRPQNMLHHALVPPARSHPFILAWHWRYEMALLVVLPLAFGALVMAVGLDGTLLIVTTVAALLFRWPAARRRLTARAWCLLTPHRLRAGCAQAWIHTRRGHLPVVLWCVPKPYGEQALLWCPAGITAEDFAATHHILAGACYAAEVRVVTHPKYRHLVTLEVIR